jgi:hypothetical protein
MKLALSVLCVADSFLRGMTGPESNERSFAFGRGDLLASASKTRNMTRQAIHSKRLIDRVVGTYSITMQRRKLTSVRDILVVCSRVAYSLDLVLLSTCSQRAMPRSLLRHRALDSLKLSIVMVLSSLSSGQDVFLLVDVAEQEVLRNN